MATILHINEKLYREAEAAAHREGISATRFVEETLKARLRKLEQCKETDPVSLPTYAGSGFHYSPQQLKMLA